MVTCHKVYGLGKKEMTMSNDLILDKNYKRGSKGKKVKLIQEWLSLNTFGVVTDGDFGAASDFAVRQFQKKKNLKLDGVVGKNTFAALIKPMKYVLQEQASKPLLGTTVVAYAKRHSKQLPREIGGQNRGPWVRLYMKGNEGHEWAWCAGFACFLLQQACKSKQLDLPITPSFSCDSLAASAKERGLFLSERRLDRSVIKPGMFFLNRRTSTDWTHVGIVIEANEEVFMTIEGNTNDEGRREGYEVCQRIRDYRKKDFIII